MNKRAIISVGSSIALILLFVSVVQGSEFKRTVLQVAGMHCGSCLRVIDAELRKMPGVVGMAASFSEERVIVDHEVAVSIEEVSGMITDLGYPTTVTSSEPLPEAYLRRFKQAGFGSGSGCCNPGGTNPVAESWRELRRRFFNGQRRGRGGISQAPERSE